VSGQPAQRPEKILARVAREQGLDQERLRRWVSFLALCGVLEQAERGVIDTYLLKGGVAMELRVASAARTTKRQRSQLQVDHARSFHNMSASLVFTLNTGYITG
jgi:hypothetical protein